jgi:DNA-binding CsgD family transcriptional regulator
MNKAGLIAYFLISYSLGLAALVVSLASYLKRRGRVARNFFFASLVLAAISTSTLIMNLLDSGTALPLLAWFRLVNYAGAAVFITVLPLLIHSVYKTAHARALNRGFLILSCVTVAGAAAIALAGRPETGGMLVLGVKDLAILYATVRMFLYRRRRHDGEMENVLHFIMIGLVIIFPIIAVMELAPALFHAVLPIESRGAISLPLAYMVWSVAYLLSWFRGYVRTPAATADSYRQFSDRFGLSPREAEVLGLLLGGQSYKEIMASLSVTMPTVKSHVGSIYRKTECNNKMQLSLLFSSSVHTKV